MKNTPEEAKQVVLAFYDDEAIEKTSTFLEGQRWYPVTDPEFNFSDFRYRIKQDAPREYWVIGGRAFESPWEAAKLAVASGQAAVHVKEVRK